MSTSYSMQYGASVRYNAFDLSGKVAVVTGGNTGIGFGMAHALGAAGASVCVWGTNAERNRAAAGELRSAGVEAAAISCDVGRESSVESAFRRTLERFGRVDALFANAGADGFGPFVEMSAAEWRRVVRVNLDGVFLSFRAAARHMMERGGGGSLVATSSIAALQGRARREHYVAAKAGVLGLVRSLAIEMAPHGIRVNAIVPGPVDTEMALKAVDRDKIQARIAARSPMGRSGQPSEFGGVAVYLASAASSYHTGDQLVVDGGYTVA